MGGCLNCGHEYERHLFGGMCFYCDCKRAIYDTAEPFGIARAAKRTNGAKPTKKTTQPGVGKPRRLGAK